MSNAVRSAITRRIANQHIELIRCYGLDAVVEEIDDEAAFVGEVEEIGSSDISCWVNAIRQRDKQRQRYCWNCDCCRAA